MEIVRTPQLNANEDEVEVVDVVVSNGDEVAAGDLLCVVESTKATYEVEAPAPGYVRRLNLEVGDRLEVGTLIAAITETPDESVESIEAAADEDESDRRVTRKARELAEQHDIDLSDVEARGIVKARDVREQLDAKAQPDQKSLETFSNEQSSPLLARQAGQRQAVIYGAGGHGRVLVDLLRQARPDLEIIGFVDDGETLPDKVLGLPVVGDSSKLAELREQGVQEAFLGVGAVTDNSVRIELYDRLVNLGFMLPNAIHPDATVEPSASLGRGNQVFAGAVVSSAVEIGENTIINSNVVVSHDCQIGSHSHITPGANLGGGVEIGKNSVVGMGASIYLNLTIGDDVSISNGVDVLRDVEDGQTLRTSQS